MVIDGGGIGVVIVMYCFQITEYSGCFRQCRSWMVHPRDHELLRQSAQSRCLSCASLSIQTPYPSQTEYQFRVSEASLAGE